MPERSQYEPGTPSWVDLQTSDQAGAKTFYAALFGWDYDDAPMGDGAVYSMARKNGKDVAAIAPLPMPGVPPHWNTYVSVADVDETAAQVPGAGGSTMGDSFDVMDAGRMAIASYPTGAMSPHPPKTTSAHAS
jgi:predicted enzyme related to lactoylglutathione lyase